MIYKYRYLIAFLAFIFLVVLGGYLAGGATCQDGWKSSSIGARGACSHHGGVESNGGIVISASAFITYGLICFIGSLYRVHGRYIVRSSLPRHPLEGELNGAKNFSLHKLPKSEANSRRDFVCSFCHGVFPHGTKYKFYEENSYRVKFCICCAKKITELNRSIKADKQLHNARILNIRSEIESYYAKHAKAKVFDVR